MNTTDLNNMKLHERVMLDNFTEVVRVVGGWVYRFFQPNGQQWDVNDTRCDYFNIDSVFVPHIRQRRSVREIR